MADQIQIQTMNQDQEDPMVEIMPNLITAMSYLLQRVSETNDILSQKQNISTFHGLTKPSISVRSYLKRIFKYANCSNSCYIVAYIYLDRFLEKQPFLRIDSFNVHRLIITSVLISAKFMDDLNYNNGYYAKVGGISIEEMNMLELDFLFGIGFELNVTVATFDKYCSFLKRDGDVDEDEVSVVRTLSRIHKLFQDESCDESTRRRFVIYPSQHEATRCSLILIHIVISYVTYASDRYKKN